MRRPRSSGTGSTTWKSGSAEGERTERRGPAGGPDEHRGAWNGPERPPVEGRRVALRKRPRVGYRDQLPHPPRPERGRLPVPLPGEPQGKGAAREALAG